MIDVSPSHLIIIASLALLLGLLLVLGGKNLRRHRGLADRRTVDLDQKTLVSHRYGLVGRPDRLYQENGFVIPEEWKSSHHPRPWHRLQLGVYFLLVEEHYRLRPPYGFIVCGDGSRHRVANDESLKAEVLDIAAKIRVARSDINTLIPVKPDAWQCRPCGMRGHCGQARV